jgi:hypothetical protein
VGRRAQHAEGDPGGGTRRVALEKELGAKRLLFSFLEEAACLVKKATASITICQSIEAV